MSVIASSFRLESRKLVHHHLFTGIKGVEWRVLLIKDWHTGGSSQRRRIVVEIDSTLE